MRIGRLVAAWVLAALGLALTRAGAGPLILFVLDHRASYLWAGLLMIVGLGLVIAATTALLWVLAKLDAEQVRNTLEIRHVVMVAAAAVLCVAFALWPLTVPPVVGSIAVVSGQLRAVRGAVRRVAAAVRALRAAARHDDARPTAGPGVHPAGNHALASALLPDGGYHKIRTTDAMPRRVQLGSVWDRWREANCVDSATRAGTAGDHDRRGRRHSWLRTGRRRCSPHCRTSQRRHARRVRRSRTSSGSAASAAAASARRRTWPSGRTTTSDWYDAALGKPDFASTALAGAFLRDLPRGLIGSSATDRAGLLETAWERKVHGLSADYFTKLKPGLDAAGRQWTPVTLVQRLPG